MKHTFRSLLLGLLLAASLTISAQEPAPQKKPYRAYLVCNSHLDTQWNWDVQTSIREYLPRVLFHNLYLMERYPDYRFNFEGGVKYAWMKEYYPLQYAQLKKYIQSGQWHISGASWDANDTNVPSPESAIRNILLGQEFYKAEFGTRSTDIFLPDCFGFSSTLPTIAAHCNLIGFSTQKLNWRKTTFYDNPEQPRNPFAWGVWRGLDGASVLAAFDTGAYNDVLPDSVQYNKALIARAARGFDNTCFRYYSGEEKHSGDRGNTGTVLTCRRLEASLNDPKAPIEIISATSDQLFLDYLHHQEELPSYQGELLMDLHGTGCYTSQSAMKYYNRRNEELVEAAERASVVADWLGAMPYNKAKINEVWQRFIWHQFHDDLTGTSIPEAYRWSWNDELIALRQSEEVMHTAVAALSYSLDTQVKGEAIVVYNSTPYPVQSTVAATIPLTDEQQVVFYGPDGRRVPAQILRRHNGQADILFAAKVPSVGFAVYDMRKVAKTASRTTLKASERSLENSVYRLQLNERGDIISLYDKRHKRELVAPNEAIRLAKIENNHSKQWPAWEVLHSVVEQPSTPITDNARISIEEQGPLRVALRVERTWGDSHFTQHIRLTEGAEADRIDICTEVDWHGNEVLVKAEFPLAIANEKAIYDLGLGHIERGNNVPTAYEVPAYKWASLREPQGSYGVAILNDSKYGWDKPNDHTLRLTLFHNPLTEKRYPYQALQDHGKHTFTYSIVAYEGATYTRVRAAAETLNAPLKAFRAPKHQGTLGRTFSMVESATPQLGIRALKKAEDGDGYIVRCYELSGQPVEQGMIRFAAPIHSAEACYATEERCGEAHFEGNTLYVSTNGFSPKTFRVRLAAPEHPATIDVAAKPVTLPYNITAFSTDEFHTYYRFDREHSSFAAELIPDMVYCQGIPFRMGVEIYPDAVRCQGQRITLPEGTYDEIHLLVAAANEACEVEFRVGDMAQKRHIPLWKGFYGQWGWSEYSESSLTKEVIAHVGTHRHRSGEGNMPYEFSYLYHITLEVPEGARELILPDQAEATIFAATLSKQVIGAVEPLGSNFYHPNNQ
nr:alpha-mannosidase [Rikenellaceae bacterium]